MTPDSPRHHHSTCSCRDFSRTGTSLLSTLLTSLFVANFTGSKSSPRPPPTVSTFLSRVLRKRDVPPTLANSHTSGRRPSSVYFMEEVPPSLVPSPHGPW